MTYFGKCVLVATVVALCFAGAIYHALQSHPAPAPAPSSDLTPQIDSAVAAAMQSYAADAKAHIVGATQPIAGQTYNLSGSGISSSATSIALTGLTIKQTGQLILGTDLVGTAGTFYVTIEPGSNSKQEIVGCTGVTPGSSSATLTGCTRGLSPIYPYTASTTMQFTHAGGASVIFSNPPQLFTQYLALANAATSTNWLAFSSTTPPKLDGVGPQGGGSYIASTSELATVAYVLATSFAGTGNAAEGSKGIVDLATARQMASSTSGGASASKLVMQSKYATDTPQAPCASGFSAGASCAVVADLGGHIKQAFLDLTATFTNSGAWIFNGAVTIIANASNKLTLGGSATTWAIANTASSTALMSDGSGNLTLNAVSRLLGVVTTQFSSTGGTASTTVTNQTIAANTLGANGVIQMDAYISNFFPASGADFVEIAFGNGTTTCSATSGANVDTNGVMHFIIAGKGATNSQLITMSYSGSDHSTNNTSFSCSATKSIATDSTASNRLMMVWKPNNASSIMTVDTIVTTVLRN